ncbi:hypothetical protein [Bacillus cereus]|uniref:Uncharacterized protein n=1 Tax=Bacillus cereus TaxID=1396 RepID=A0A2A7HWT2_BACCE|nr:hypothetical protein [Bacillus cereus]PEC21407.1 hypothetical protein COM96_14145 [Bacillus cereus]
MINYSTNNNRILGSATTIHSVQGTMHAMHHAMQQCCPETVHYYYPTIQYHPIQYTHQSIYPYPTGFTTTPFY